MVVSITYNLFDGSRFESAGPGGSSVYLTEFLTITYTDAPTDPYITVVHRVEADTQGKDFPLFFRLQAADSRSIVNIPYDSSLELVSSGANSQFITNTYTVQNGSSFNVIARGYASNNLYSDTATVSASYTVLKCPSEGFVFVDTSTGPQKALLLPSPSNNKKLLFIKDKNWNAATNNITVVAPTGVNIDGANTKTINDNGGCLTLVSDGTQYWIANYYPSNRQLSLYKANGSLVTNSDKIASASINTINVFSVDKNTARQSGDNRINLPTASRGAICVIVYAGSNSSKLNDGNVLNINSSTTIDNNSEYTSTNTPYIYTDESYKSSGAVCISDGLTWFIAGWYFGSFWQWGATDQGRYQDIPSKDAYLRIDTWKNQVLYRMVSDEAPCLKIVKVNHNNRQCYSVANANDSSVTEVYLNTSNSTSSRHCLEYHSGNQYSCVWLASARVGANTYYYPIIGYTPN